MPIIAAVTTGAGQMAGAAANSDAARAAARDWAAVRGSSDIQFAPLPQVKEPIAQTPAWLRTLGEWLEAIFAPIGKLLGMSWPIFQYVLIALAVLLALFVVWRLVAPVLAERRMRDPGDGAEPWTPDRTEAAALLSDADRLAAEGRFAEATHLLLRRSVQQIRGARREWVNPSSTAREISVLPALPEAGRHAFATIAQRVERSRFALRDLDGEDWAAARAAYAEFAQVRLAV